MKRENKPKSDLFLKTYIYKREIFSPPAETAKSRGLGERLKEMSKKLNAFLIFHIFLFKEYQKKKN